MNSNSGRVLALLVAAISSSLLTYGQQPSSSPSDNIRAGGISFVFPSPGDGLVEPGADYRVLLEPLAPTQNRLVAAFVKPEVADALRTGTYRAQREYALIEVGRRLEFADITSEMFKQIQEAMGKQLMGDITGTLQDQQEEMNRRMKALGSADTVTLQNPVPLGQLFSSEDAVGFGMVFPVAVDQKSVKMATAINVILIRHRVFFAYLYIEYKDESTVTWLRTTSAQWMSAILKANP